MKPWMWKLEVFKVTSYFAFPIVMFLIYHKSEKLIQYYKGPDYQHHPLDDPDKEGGKLIEKYLKGRARGKGPKSIQSTDLEEEELRKLESR
ncbi:Hypothetical predicted protein [Mytilus galloprovincialis]|uniref:Protein PET100 homolog, mitochondrial n=1 Tax=Mytilus galloprovincialis TaxID=29158 RepID=A0A8B6C9D4_MYTGA|nr:Hypothetical predicted protein [Mytilus galloprovincialis]